MIFQGVELAGFIDRVIYLNDAMTAAVLNVVNSDDSREWLLWEKKANAARGPFATADDARAAWLRGE